MEKENLERTLAEHPFFKGLDARYISLLAGCASNVVFKAGEFVFREGEQADTFYIIRHGKVALEWFVPQKGAIAVQTFQEGSVMGWSWLVPPHQWRGDTRAYDLTRAIALDGKCLRDKCEADHDFGYEIMRRIATLVAETLHATRLQLMDIYGNDQQK
jgi:CRP/FNR family transcriptional regulator, cyclic AMP receptor protein